MCVQECCPGTATEAGAGLFVSRHDWNLLDDRVHFTAASWCMEYYELIERCALCRLPLQVENIKLMLAEQPCSEVGHESTRRG